MSFHHVVAFRFKPEVTAAQLVALTSELQSWAPTVPGLRYYGCGADLQLREGNDDYAVAAVFETEDALKGYLDHPVHHDIVARHITGRYVEKHGAQFSVPQSDDTAAVAVAAVDGAR